MRKIITIAGIILICGLFSGFANGSSDSLSRVISVMKILARMEGSASDADINANGKVTIADAIYGLQVTAGLRSAPARIFAGGASNARTDGSTGTVKSWGRNDVGQLGTGNTADPTATPTSVNLGVGKGAKQVAVGIEHACAILNDNSVSCWGSNSSGQLGQPLTTTISSSPLPVPDVTAKAVAVGLEHTCIITLTGSVQCWGSNVKGQLGRPVGNPIESYLPQAAITGLSAKTIKSGYNYMCAIALDDTVKCWGDNQYGQLGNNSKVDSSTIVSAGSLSGVTQLTAGAYHSCAATSSTISCWGRNDSGELGSNGTTSLSVPTRTNIIRSGVSQLVAGLSHTCALSGTTVECWGSNANKQLSGSTAGGNSFVKVSLTNSPLSLSAGLTHTCAQDSKDQTYCWGAGTQGRLGPNATADSATPVLVP
ncbi:MAG: hypothetical protein WCK00_06905 [Deltaproteobacteria bacterium]